MLFRLSQWQAFAIVIASVFDLASTAPITFNHALSVRDANPISATAKPAPHSEPQSPRLNSNGHDRETTPETPGAQQDLHPWLDREEYLEFRMSSSRAEKL